MDDEFEQARPVRLGWSVTARGGVLSVSFGHGKHASRTVSGEAGPNEIRRWLQLIRTPDSIKGDGQAIGRRPIGSVLDGSFIVSDT